MFQKLLKLTKNGFLWINQVWFKRTLAKKCKSKQKYTNNQLKIYITLKKALK